MATLSQAEATASEGAETSGGISFLNDRQERPTPDRVEGYNVEGDEIVQRTNEGIKWLLIPNATKVVV